LSDLDKVIHQSADFVSTHVRYSRASEAHRRNALSPHAKIPTPITPNSLSASLRAAFNEGYSLIFDEVLTVWWPLARNIEALIVGQVTASMFFSPPRSHGVPLHYDGFDVSILQIAGDKEWIVYPPHIPLPIGPKPLGDIDPGEPLALLTLRPGDLLYMPRGFIHEAHSGESPAMHLTVGLHACRWCELLAELIEGLAESEVGLRQSVSPPVCRAIAAGVSDGDATTREHLADLLAYCVANATVAAPILRHARKFIDSLQPLIEEGFAVAAVPDGLDGDVVIAKPNGTVCYVYDEDGKSVIGFPGGSIRGPATIRPALEWIAHVEGPFRPADLPDDLSAQSKRVLVLRLVRDGLLRVNRTGV
jgi:lysine-specific demethylase/histidyl-hydroxylase NO66